MNRVAHGAAVYAVEPILRGYGQTVITFVRPRGVLQREFVAVAADGCPIVLRCQIARRAVKPAVGERFGEGAVVGECTFECGGTATANGVGGGYTHRRQTKAHFDVVEGKIVADSSFCTVGYS